MLPGVCHLSVKQGGTWRLPLQVRNPDDTPVDLAGRTARMQIRASHDAEHVLLELSTENGRIVIDGAGGEITLQASAVDTAALPPGLAVYDLELMFAGETDPLLEGRVHVYPEVTR